MIISKNLQKKTNEISTKIRSPPASLPLEGLTYGQQFCLLINLRSLDEAVLPRTTAHSHSRTCYWPLPYLALHLCFNGSICSKTPFFNLQSFTC